MKSWILFIFTLPWALSTWLLGLLSILTGFATKPRFVGAGILTLEWRAWWIKHWKYSTTIGRCIWFRPDRRDPAAFLDERIERHEMTHVRQIEDLMLLSLIWGIIGVFYTHSWWAGLLIWWSGGMWQLPDFITAWLRYGNFYRDTEHERSAYAQTDLDPDGSSWWVARDSKRDLDE